MKALGNTFEQKNGAQNVGEIVIWSQFSTELRAKRSPYVEINKGIYLIKVKQSKMVHYFDDSLSNRDIQKVRYTLTVK